MLPEPSLKQYELAKGCSWEGYVNKSTQMSYICGSISTSVIEYKVFK